MEEISIPSVLNAIFGQTPKSLVNQAYLDQANPAPTTPGDPGYADTMGYGQPGMTNNLGNAVKQLPYTDPNIFTKIFNSGLANQISSANAAYQLRPGEAQQQYDIQRGQLKQAVGSIPVGQLPFNGNVEATISGAQFPNISAPVLLSGQNSTALSDAGYPAQSARAAVNEAWANTLDAQNKASQAQAEANEGVPSSRASTEAMRLSAAKGLAFNQNVMAPSDLKEAWLNSQYNRATTIAALKRQATSEKTKDIYGKVQQLMAEGAYNKQPDVNTAEGRKAAYDATVSGALPQTAGIDKQTAILNAIGQNANAHYQPAGSPISRQIYDDGGGNYRVGDIETTPGYIRAASKMNQLSQLGDFSSAGSSLSGGATRIPGGTTIRSPDGSALPMKPTGTPIHLGGDSDVAVPANLPMPARPVRAEPIVPSQPGSSSLAVPTVAPAVANVVKQALMNQPTAATSTAPRSGDDALSAYQNGKMSKTDAMKVLRKHIIGPEWVQASVTPTWHWDMQKGSNGNLTHTYLDTK